MNYSEEQMIEEKKRSFDDGLRHSKSSPETKAILASQTEEFKRILDAHERLEQENNEELSRKIIEVTKLIEKHIEETSLADKTMRELIVGSKVAKVWFFTLVGVVSGIGILAASIIAIKEWIKR